jgi:DNA-binding MarR family transcriptional regulator
MAAEVWAGIVQAVTARREHMLATAASFELTLPQAHLLRILQQGPARTMTSLADLLSCDASNITGIVDRLEARGLIERVGSRDDRRIKSITLTAQGRALSKELKDAFLRPPESMQTLTERQLGALHGLVCDTLGWWKGGVRGRGRRGRGRRAALT